MYGNAIVIWDWYRYHNLTYNNFTASLTCPSWEKSKNRKILSLRIKVILHFTNKPWTLIHFKTDFDKNFVESNIMKTQIFLKIK